MISVTPSVLGLATPPVAVDKLTYSLEELFNLRTPFMVEIPEIAYAHPSKPTVLLVHPPPEGYQLVRIDPGMPIPRGAIPVYGTPVLGGIYAPQAPTETSHPGRFQSFLREGVKSFIPEDPPHRFSLEGEESNTPSEWSLDSSVIINIVG